MSGRMNKYFDEEVPSSRLAKNEELYKEISKSELDNYEVKSNSTVLGANNAEIDVEKIKKILDTRYNEIPKRRSIRLEESKTEEEQQEDTKEYDINVILERAKEQKNDNYEEERLKKIRDTQFDILKNLQINEKSKDDSEPSEAEETDENLKKLINTIAINEKEFAESSSTNPALDILSDLKGEDGTEVLEGLKEEVQDELEKELEKTIKGEVKEKDNNDTQMINSFYTKSNIIKDKDFEDIEEFQKSIESNNTFIKVVIGLIVVIIIIGIIILIKSLYFS